MRPSPAALGLVLVLVFGCSGSTSPPAPKPENASAPAAAPADKPDPAPAPAPAPAAPVAAGFKRMELPGFAVDMPVGEVKTDRSASYDDGEYVVQADGSVAMAIWAPGGIVGNRIAEEAMVTATARSAGIPLTLSATHDAEVQGARVARTYVLSYERIDVVITVAECGRRAISIAAAGVGDGPDETRKQMVASLRCAREDAREASAPPPIELAMPAGWRRRTLGQEEVRWERDTEVLTFVWTTGSEPAHLASFEGVLPALGYTDRAAPASPVAGRTTWVARGPAGRRAFGVVIPCGGRFVLGIYSGQSEDDARAWLGRARCPT